MHLEHEQLLESLKGRVKALIRLLESERERNNALKGRNEEMSEKLKEMNRNYEIMKNNYENMKMSKIIEITGKDIADARKKINGIVREVDFCIALLDK